MLRRFFASSSSSKDTATTNVGTLSNIKKSSSSSKKSSTPMESLVRLFEPSLRSLSMRKDFRMVKDTAERALFKLRTVIKMKDVSSLTSSVLEDLMRPFLLACNYNKEVKSLQMVLESFGTIQRVMTQYKSILSVQSLRDVLRVLRIQTDRKHPDDHIRLKVLQSLPLLLSCDNFFFSSGSKIDEDEDEVKLLKDVLTIAFELFFGSKSSMMIRNTSLATLRQLVTLLFENDSKIARRGAERLLRDLCTALEMKKSSSVSSKDEGDRNWISITISKRLSLELLQLILKRFHEILKLEFSDLLTNKISLGLVENFKSMTSVALMKSEPERLELMAPLIETITTLLEHCLTRVPDHSEILLSMMTKQLSLVSATTSMMSSLRHHGSFSNEKNDESESSSTTTTTTTTTIDSSGGFIQSTASSISERLGLTPSTPRGGGSSRRVLRNMEKKQDDDDVNEDMIQFSVEENMLWNIVKALNHLSRQESFLLAVFRKFRDDTNECEMLDMIITRMASFLDTLCTTFKMSNSELIGLTSNMLRVAKLKSDRYIFFSNLHLKHFVDSVRVKIDSRRKRGTERKDEDDEDNMLSEIFHVSLLVLSADIFLELGSHLCRLNRKTDEEKRRLSTEIIGKDSPTRRHTSPTRRDPRKREMFAILNHIWKPWIDALCKVIKVLKTNDEEYTNRILKVYERFLDTCAALINIDALLGTFSLLLTDQQQYKNNNITGTLDGLCDVAFPSLTSSSPTSSITLNRKHVQCCKSLLNIVTTDAELLKVEGWTRCIRALRHLNSYVGPYLLVEPEPSGEREILRSEYALLNRTMKGVFEITSREISDSALMELIRGLVCVVKEEEIEENKQKQEINKDEESQKSPKKKMTRRDMMRDRFRKQAMEALGVVKEKKEAQPDKRRRRRRSMSDERFALRSLVATLLAQKNVGRWPDWNDNLKPAFAKCGNTKVGVIALGHVLKRVSTEDKCDNLIDCVLESLTTSKLSIHLLETLLEHLQEHGDAITTSRGWEHVLSILTQSSSSSLNECIALGFRCLEVVVGEFLPNMVASNVSAKRIVRSLLEFASQRKIVNVSLSAVNLFWNVADHVKSVEIKEVLMGLRKVAVDSRPDVRNCAMRSLASTIVSSGSNFRIHPEWTFTMNDILMPLLCTVRENQERAAAKHDGAEDEESENDLGRNTKGERIRMVVHHTRDTTEKQWHETSVIALQGVTRIVRQFLASWIANACSTLDSSSPFQVKRKNSLISPKGTPGGNLSSWFFGNGAEENEESDDSVQTVRKWIRVVWLNLLRHLRVCVLNVPSSTERREVSLAAVEALRKLLSTVASRGAVGETKYTSRMRVVDGALVRVDEDGNEIMKQNTTIKTPITNRTTTMIRTPASAKRLWDDLASSLWSVFETIVTSDSVTKDLKDKDGGLEVLSSILNHINDACGDQFGVSWWSHLTQVRKVLNLITKTHEICILPTMERNDLSRNSKLCIAKRYGRISEPEKALIAVFETICDLTCDKEENNNMNAVRHVLFDRYITLLGSRSRQVFLTRVAESMTMSYSKVSMKNKLTLFEALIGNVSKLLERLIAMSSGGRSEKAKVKIGKAPGIVQKNNNLTERIDIVQKTLLRILKSTCECLSECFNVGHRKDSLALLFYVLLRVSTEGTVVKRGMFGEDVTKTCEILLSRKVRSRRGKELLKSILQTASLVAVNVLGRNVGEKFVTQVLSRKDDDDDDDTQQEEKYSLEDLFRMADSRKSKQQQDLKKLSMVRSLLMSRCRSILMNFVERGLTENVSDVLSRLLELNSGGGGEWSAVDGVMPPKRLYEDGSVGEKAHLLHLLPVLVKCVGTDLKKERRLAQACLEAALLEIGFRRASGSSEL